MLQPDSGKIGAFEREARGRRAYALWFRREDAVEYYDGESAPG